MWNIKTEWKKIQKRSRVGDVGHIKHRSLKSIRKYFKRIGKYPFSDADILAQRVSKA